MTHPLDQKAKALEAMYEAAHRAYEDRADGDQPHLDALEWAVQAALSIYLQETGDGSLKFDLGYAVVPPRNTPKHLRSVKVYSTVEAAQEAVEMFGGEILNAIDVDAAAKAVEANRALSPGGEGT